MKQICKIQFGSHLYGTNTETSDLDYKGVFLPSEEQILLGRIPKTNNSTSDISRKNFPGEIDDEYYSLYHFLRLATQGQTVAIDMLFAPDDMVLEKDHIWDSLVENRDRLLSKNMGAFVGYARGQAAKYSLKGERLNRLQKFHDKLNEVSIPDTPLGCLWKILPRDDERMNPQGIQELQIAGKWYGETTLVKHVLESVKTSISRYGTRAHAASEANGVDWKALSHAVRVSLELLEILDDGIVTFPLKESRTVLGIKLGQVPLENVQQMIDANLEEIETKMAASSLPDKVDTKWWDAWLLDVVKKYIKS